MFIRDYYNVVNTGERLYSVILDEDELRMFNEMSEEDSSDKKKNILKKGGAAVVGGAAAGVGAKYLGDKIAQRIVEKDLLKNGRTMENGIKYGAEEMKRYKMNDPKGLFKNIKVGDAAKKYGKRIKGATIAAGLTGAAAAGLAAHKYLKNKKNKE